MPSETDAPTLANLPSFRGLFPVVDDEGHACQLKWRFEPSRPCRRIGGITGWGELNGVFERIHICAQHPCIARWKRSQSLFIEGFGAMPEPLHCRFVEPAAPEDPFPAPSHPSSPQPCSPPASPPPPAPSPPLPRLQHSSDLLTKEHIKFGGRHEVLGWTEEKEEEIVRQEIDAALVVERSRKKIWRWR